MITITDRYVLEDEDYFYCYQDREEGLVQKVDEIREQLKLSASVHSTPDTVKEGPKREASTHRVQVWSHRQPSRPENRSRLYENRKGLGSCEP